MDVKRWGKGLDACRENLYSQPASRTSSRPSRSSSQVTSLPFERRATRARSSTAAFLLRRFSSREIESRTSRASLERRIDCGASYLVLGMSIASDCAARITTSQKRMERLKGVEPSTSSLGSWQIGRAHV